MISQLAPSISLCSKSVMITPDAFSILTDFNSNKQLWREVKRRQVTNQLEYDD